MSSSKGRKGMVYRLVTPATQRAEARGPQAHCQPRLSENPPHSVVRRLRRECNTAELTWRGEALSAGPSTTK